MTVKKTTSQSARKRLAGSGSSHKDSRDPDGKRRSSTTNTKSAAVARKGPTAAKGVSAAGQNGAKAKPPSRPSAKSAPPAKAAAKPAPKTPVKPVKPLAAKPAAGVQKPAPAAPPKASPPLKPVAVAPVSAPAPRERSGKITSDAKMLPRELMEQIALRIRDAVAPSVRAVKGREIVGSASSGDATFAIDHLAEKALLSFLRELKMPIAYYSEDAGYTTFSSGSPKNLLIIDPIDGTRAAKNGFEGCVVSVASTRVIERPRMKDIENALVMEIVGDRTFYAERGKGARVYIDGQSKKPKLSGNIDLERMAWSMTVPARPAELIFPTAARLIDLTSLKGGFFACNSTSYSLTRLLTNQLDACVDFANRYLRDIPDAVQDQFINAGRGIILGIAPYDMAASVLIAQEAGAIVSDAFGESFDEVLLLDSSVGNHRSLIAAANRELYDKLMSFFDTRIKQYEQLLKRRAELVS